MTDDYIEMVKLEFAIGAEVAYELLTEQLTSFEVNGVGWHQSDIDARRAQLYKEHMADAGLALVRIERA